MSRDIKFRAWNAKHSKMVEVGLIDFLEKKMQLGSFEYSLNQFPIMQYTGLKDRNGKEIYEGDIVRIIEMGFDNINDIDYFEQWLVNERIISHSVDEDGYIQYEYAKKVDIVVMDRFPRYWLKNESFGYEGEDLIDPDRCEVIGNIYENPELLESRSDIESTESA